MMDYRAAIDELTRAGRIVLTGHVKPDADALGSMAAIRRWLIGLGKSVEMILPTPPPQKYAFLDPDRAFRVAGRDVDLKAMQPPDLVCVLDTCTWQQLEGMEPLLADSGAPVLVIDHHRTCDPLADFLLSDPDAAATVIIVYGLLREAGAAIDAPTATYLFAGLVADTDWFRLPNVTPDVLRLAADLLSAGADPPTVYTHMQQSDDIARVHLLGRAVETLTPALDGRVMVMRLTRQMFREMGADIGDTENFINECMRVRGTQVGVMLVEADGDQVRVSLRSKPGTDVLQVACRFGGGGHTRAAGARLNGHIDQVQARVLQALDEAMQNGKQ